MIHRRCLGAAFLGHCRIGSDGVVVDWAYVCLNSDRFDISRSFFCLVSDLIADVVKFCCGSSLHVNRDARSSPFGYLCDLCCSWTRRPWSLCVSTGHFQWGSHSFQSGRHLYRCSVRLNSIHSKTSYRFACDCVLACTKCSFFSIPDRFRVETRWFPKVKRKRPSAVRNNTHFHLDWRCLQFDQNSFFLKDFVKLWKSPTFVKKVIDWQVATRLVVFRNSNWHNCFVVVAQQNVQLGWQRFCPAVKHVCSRQLKDPVPSQCVLSGACANERTEHSTWANVHFYPFWPVVAIATVHKIGRF